MNKDKKEGIMIVFGGSKPEKYTPMSLVSKLEEAKDALAKGSTKEAIMALDSCIVRITGKQLPENDLDSAMKTDPFFELDKILS
jgi:hypothetical protein